MRDKFFLDTNILIYTFDSREPDKQHKAREIVSDALATGNGIISFQVIQEFLNAATRKFVSPLSVADCRKYLNDVMVPICRVFAHAGLYHHALIIAERWKYSFYDALIISAALDGRCNILYTEDLQHGQIIETLTVKNPFKLSCTV